VRPLIKKLVVIAENGLGEKDPICIEILDLFVSLVYYGTLCIMGTYFSLIPF
jgi:hypothetical protein